MKGLDAISLAVRAAGVGVVNYVPGYPINEIAEALCAEISVNEKVALEIALGASATGCRSMVVVKQVGMNLLADPLIISATHTIGSGLVVLVGDDLGPKGSQAEMDSRYYGLLAELPFLDPGDPARLYYSIIEAYDLSEKLRVPAIVRVTPRLISSEGPDIRISASAHRGSGQRFDRASWEFTVQGRHQRHHTQILPPAMQASEASTLNSIEISGNIGIIASGYPSVLSKGLGVSCLSVGYTNPLPWKLISRFVQGHRLILVAEEPEPFIESQLQMSPKVRGRLTGHLPFGPLERSDVANALENLEEREIKPGGGQSQAYECARDRGYTGICDDCPFASLFKAISRLDAPVAGDAGCAIKATREPYESVDVVYGLGSSIAVASGFRKKGIAVIGDFALAHTGLPALINAVWRGRDVLVILLKNDVAAMTGGQEAPDLAELLRALVPVRRLDLSASEADTVRLIEEELAHPRSSVIIAEGRCTMHQNRRHSQIKN